MRRNHPRLGGRAEREARAKQPTCSLQRKNITPMFIGAPASAGISRPSSPLGSVDAKLSLLTRMSAWGNLVGAAVGRGSEGATQPLKMTARALGMERNVWRPAWAHKGQGGLATRAMPGRSMTSTSTKSKLSPNFKNICASPTFWQPCTARVDQAGVKQASGKQADANPKRVNVKQASGPSMAIWRGDPPLTSSWQMPQ
eukprot:353516-Chlamydomonas_euryale.AAC.7